MNLLLIKIAIAAALVLGLMGSGAYLAWKVQSGRIQAKEARIEQLSEAIHEIQANAARSEAALASARKQRQAAQAAAAASRATLENLLTRNRAWADEPVPSEIQDVLRR